nr:hypothetical protein [Mediterraneibacter gnavus]
MLIAARLNAKCSKRNISIVGTLNRYKKKSFYWYQKVIESNGEILHQELK